MPLKWCMAEHAAGLLTNTNAFTLERSDQRKHLGPTWRAGTKEAIVDLSAKVYSVRKT